MKTSLNLLSILALVAVLVGCGRSDTPAPDVDADGNPPLSVEEGEAQGEPGAPVGDVEVAFDNVLISEREAGKLWSVRATLINKSSVPLHGGEFAIELARKSEDRPFATHGTQVFFSPAVAPGRTTGFAASFPIIGVGDLPPVTGSDVRIRMTKALPAPVIADAWKPMDPTTAEVKEVGERVLVTDAGERIVLPSKGEVLRATPGPGVPAPSDVARSPTEQTPRSD